MPVVSCFINATDLDSIKPDSKSRKNIRRHVMKGKNRKQTSSRHLAFRSWINHERDSTGSTVASSSMVQVAEIQQRDSINLSLDSAMEDALGLKSHHLPLILNHIHLMTQAMYDVQSHVDVNQAVQDWLADLPHDPAYRDVLLFCARATLETQKQPMLGPVAISHMNHGIKILRKSLSEPIPMIGDSTIFVVLALSMISESLGDLKVAENHLQGLHRLIQLRGGITKLAQKRQLQYKCCRLDLRLALKIGSKPVLFSNNSISWKPYLADAQIGSEKTPIHKVCSSPDIRLVNVWLDFREFAKAVNLASQTKCLLSPIFMQELMISVQYRLQHLDYDNQGKQEMFRLGMLMLSTAIFTDHTRSGRYRHLTLNLRSLLEPMEHNEELESQRLTMWLTFVSRVTIPKTSDDHIWLNECLSRTRNRLQFSRWEDTRQILKRYIWLDFHDRAAQIS